MSSAVVRFCTHKYKSSLSRYRNKIDFTFHGHDSTQQGDAWCILQLARSEAFARRGIGGKINDFQNARVSKQEITSHCKNTPWPFIITSIAPLLLSPLLAQYKPLQQWKNKYGNLSEYFSYHATAGKGFVFIMARIILQNMIFLCEIFYIEDSPYCICKKPNIPKQQFPRRRLSLLVGWSEVGKSSSRIFVRWKAPKYILLVYQCTSNSI